MSGAKEKRARGKRNSKAETVRAAKGAAKTTAKIKDSAKAATKSAYAKSKAKGAAKAVAKSAGPKGKAKTATKARQKTSVYLDPPQRRHLEQIARRTGRRQAQLIREAIESYEPAAGADRNFALAAGFARIDSDRRPISAIPEAELMRGFGE